MTTIVAESEALRMPGWVPDLDAFHAWVESEDVPEKFKPWFLQGEVWVDMSKEQIDSHVDVKTEITSVLRQLAKTNGLGRVLGDGVLLTNREADISGNPDMLFYSNEAESEERIRRVPGSDGGFIRLEGTPDMVLEVVSRSSVAKDTDVLFGAYFAAGIPEYWLVDARGDQPIFDIYRRGPKGYVATRRQSGWVRSAVFGRSFRLLRTNDSHGHPEFTLQVK
ncbi:MAG: Uma2 family endonuclease [Gemmataceae bacterium]